MTPQQDLRLTWLGAELTLIPSLTWALATESLSVGSKTRENKRYDYAAGTKKVRCLFHSSINPICACAG